MAPAVVAAGGCSGYGVARGGSCPLARPLREWVHDTLRETPSGTGIDEDRIVERVTLRLDLVLPDAEAYEQDLPDTVTGRSSRFLAYDTPVDQLLDVVDAVLDLLPAPPDCVNLLSPPPARPGARRPAWSRVQRSG